MLVVPVFLENVHRTEKLTQKLKYRSLHFSKSALWYICHKLDQQNVHTIMFKYDGPLKSKTCKSFVN